MRVWIQLLKGLTKATAIVFLGIFVGCGNNAGSNGSLGALSPTANGPLEQAATNAVNNTPTGKKLSPADKQALQNVAGEGDTVQPQRNTSLPPNLLKQLQQLAQAAA